MQYLPKTEEVNWVVIVFIEGISILREKGTFFTKISLLGICYSAKELEMVRKLQAQPYLVHSSEIIDQDEGQCVLVGHEDLVLVVEDAADVQLVGVSAPLKPGGRRSRTQQLAEQTPPLRFHAVLGAVVHGGHTSPHSLGQHLVQYPCCDVVLVLEPGQGLVKSSPRGRHHRVRVSRAE